MLPLIALTTEPKPAPANARTRGSVALNWNYAEEVARAGGCPVIVPPTADPETVARSFAAWLIPGGLDMDAARFGQPNHPACELQDPSRYAFEESLYRVWPAEKPILGICYGLQFLNVVRGGDLLQHLPDHLGHDDHAGGRVAPVTLEPGSRLAEIVGAESLEGASWHHQAIGRLGAGLRVSARHADGTIEAIEATDRPWEIAVQWHPERTPDSDASRRLFAAFVAAAG